MRHTHECSGKIFANCSNVLAILIAAVLALAGLFLLNPTSVEAQLGGLGAGRAEKPNIILINLDDADADLISRANILSRYPNLSRFVTHGIQFTNFHVTTPICGPSRASMLRGQYAHRTGFRSNDPNAFRSNGFNGGVNYYVEQGHSTDDLSTWMQSAGYRTMLIGKYLHGITEVPDGWDDFYNYLGASYFGTYRFTNETNPEGSGQVMPTNTYRTELEAADAVNLINQHADRNDGKPFFMYLAPLAPHTQAGDNSELGMISNSYRDWWVNMRMPQSPAIDEINMNDKTTALRELERFDENWLALLDSRYRERVLAIKSVDDMFGQIYNALGVHGLTDNTYIIFTSDNGMLTGHHRLFGKSNCFNQTTHVATYVTGPGIAGNQQARHLLAQIDLAPTIVDLAEGQVPIQVDGKSFKNLLLNPTGFDERNWREALLIENWESRKFRGNTVHQGSNAVRFFDEVYAEWADGTSEYYDLTTDPLQIRNTWKNLSPADRQLYSDYMRMLKNIGDEPEVTISNPWDAGSLASRKDEILGIAIDDEGVDRVRVAIRRIDDFFFWTGSAWQEGRYLLDAEITNPGQQMTTWRIRNMPRMSSSDDFVGVWPRVYDLDGNFNSEVPGQVFRIDFNRPESNVLAPAVGTTIAGGPAVIVSGTSSDDRSVESIRLVVQNQTANEYYNGTSWQTDWTYVLIPANDDGTWSYTMPPTSGVIYAASRSVDDSGNVQKRPAFTYFTLL